MVNARGSAPRGLSPLVREAVEAISNQVGPKPSRIVLFGSTHEKAHRRMIESEQSVSGVDAFLRRQKAGELPKT